MKEILTFKDKIKEEHPEKVNKRYNGGVAGCPWHYAYEPYSESFSNCVMEDKCCECWNREIPKERR